jgi:hypothetical protein
MALPRALRFQYGLRMPMVERLADPLRGQAEEDRDRQLEDYLAELEARIAALEGP